MSAKSGPGANILNPGLIVDNLKRSYIYIYIGDMQMWNW